MDAHAPYMKYIKASAEQYKISHSFLHLNTKGSKQRFPQTAGY